VFIAVVSAAQGRPQEGEVPEDVRRFYERNGHRTVWSDATGSPTPEARTAIARLASAADDGLDVEEYLVTALDGEATALARTDAPLSRDIAAFDVRLTESVLRYFRHLHLGRVDPRDLGFDLDHRTEPHDFPELLQTAISTGTLDRAISELRPRFVQYHGLRDRLGTFRGRHPARARQIELAMERLRWLPDLTGERVVVVNIPMFYVWGWNAGQANGIPAIGMAAIIGRAATRTPVFMAAMTSIIINPSWHVPESIVRNEILPALARNPDYLRRRHMEMTRTGGTPRVRQLPGPWNALGRIKFSFPNPYDVYLHGTPAPKLFNRARRDFSHGCVRVEDPTALAEWLLSDEATWTRDRIIAAIEQGTTRTVELGAPVRVVMFYTTAGLVPGEERIRFADDIYGHDAPLDARLRTRTGSE
jgi:murein L,D-transpeptidase YcbB/YkuD